ncbi:site-specific DNA-methyltransferase [Conexibacter sp. CPCC 206217]|uniref:DNA-methyltransferase n=1 Tax=Conexibacter sp. CPCC 206217 TaxID=3064574 RepID=UPI00271B6F20|nr:site-specific DNA-methyltransferase [Conexibacter sp. CPCC 206217]MDO8213478.1 site-specific DNA-methyltransferase [Conexibacter sp. CPCC 206217]
MTPRNCILIGDAATRLRTLPAGSIDCIVTSPPYFGLRDYGVSGQLGQEAHVDDWVAGLLAVCRELRRVLAPHGTLWLNLGDAYSTHARYGAAPKSLLMAPERVARALIADGWLLRNKVVWSKPNPLPSPTRDRLTNAHEFVYALTTRPSYFYDLDAIREPLQSVRKPSAGSRTPQTALGKLTGGRDGLVAMARTGRSGHPLGKNPSDVWRLGSASYRGAHFATFPPALVRRPILATCPPAVCSKCGQPWRRSTRAVAFQGGQPLKRPFVPCGCGAPTRPGVVLDPFFGTGTVALVAREHGRDWLGIELNPDYVPLAERRLGEAIRRA